MVFVMAQAMMDTNVVAVMLASIMNIMRMKRYVLMETEKKLLLFTVEAYLGDSDHTTSFATFAYDCEAAEFFVKDYIDHYITDDYRIHGVFLSEIKEGVVLIND